MFRKWLRDFEFQYALLEFLLRFPNQVFKAYISNGMKSHFELIGLYGNIFNHLENSEIVILPWNQNWIAPLEKIILNGSVIHFTEKLMVLKIKDQYFCFIKTLSNETLKSDLKLIQSHLQRVLMISKSWNKERVIIPFLGTRFGELSIADFLKALFKASEIMGKDMPQITIISNSKCNLIKAASILVNQLHYHTFSSPCTKKSFLLDQDYQYLPSKFNSVFFRERKLLIEMQKNPSNKIATKLLKRLCCSTLSKDGPFYLSGSYPILKLLERDMKLLPYFKIAFTILNSKKQIIWKVMMKDADEKDFTKLTKKKRRKLYEKR